MWHLEFGHNIVKPTGSGEYYIFFFFEKCGPDILSLSFFFFYVNKNVEFLYGIDQLLNWQTIPNFKNTL